LAKSSGNYGVSGTQTFSGLAVDMGQIVITSKAFEIVKKKRYFCLVGGYVLVLPRLGFGWLRLAYVGSSNIGQAAAVAWLGCG
jgi:hypothetical protein